jgi:hypothetical protein
MATELSQLKPYESLLLGRKEGDQPLDTLVSSILAEATSFLQIDTSVTSPISRKKKGGLEATASGELVVGFLHYLEERPASWTSDVTIKDRLNHLVLICARGSHVAILLTDSGRKTAFLKRFKGDGKAPGLGSLSPIPSGLLNAAFVTGSARTLWLTGTHRRTSIKADNKVLSGISLEDALDPLEDQSFYFSAARCTPVLGAAPPKPIGVVPRSSRIWVGTSKDWEDCREAITLLLSHLETVRKPKDAPLPVLAVSTSNFAAVQGAFDVSLQPPEARPEMPGGSSEEREAVEELAYQVQFHVIGTAGPNFEAEAWLAGEKLGRFEVIVSSVGMDQADVSVHRKPDSISDPEKFEQLLRLCSDKDWLKVRYDSGHTLSDGAIFAMRHRDVPFEDFDWANLTDFWLSEEKPYRLVNDRHGRQRKEFYPADIGKQKSLFCWVQKFWPSRHQDSSGGSWLACNDGSMEIADFIHLDLDSKMGRPRISLIHVKGAGSEAANRGISVSSYEIVTGQAVKNLRHLDRLNLAQGLDKGLGTQIRDLVWYDRTIKPRDEMIRALESIGANYDREVVILQPHLTRSRYNATRANRADKDYARLQQLDTLLISARASCANLGASFRVIADAS